MAMTQAVDTAAWHRGERFRLHAFVCSVTCVKRTDRDPPPTLSFQQIYQQRPAGCRYAVVGLWVPDPSKNCERYYVLDLYEARRTFDNTLVLPRKPRLVHDDLDAAIMATVLLYDK